MSAAPVSLSDTPGRSSDREIIAYNTQQLINDINNKRKRDSSLILGEWKSWVYSETSDKGHSEKGQTSQ